MIVPMSRVRLLGPREQLDPTIALLQDLGLVHLAAPPDQPALRPYQLSPAALRRHRTLRRVLVDTEVALAGLANPPPPRTPAGPLPLPAWARQAHRVRRELARLTEQETALGEEQALLARYHGFLDAFEALLRAQGAAPGAMMFHVVLRADQAGAIPQLREALDQLLQGSAAVFTQRLTTGETAMLLLVPRSAAGQVERLLAQSRVQEVPVPAGYGSSLSKAIPRMREREARIPVELGGIRRERDRLRRQHGAELARARAVLRDRLLQLEALPLSRTTAHAFVLDGWLPTAAQNRLAHALQDRLGTAVVTETVAREQWGAEAPVVLRNPRLFRPFEVLTAMLPLPRYGSLDPTPFVAVFFPMFFGLMLGDVGYGLVLAILALLVRARAAPASVRRAIAEVAGAGAAFAVVFGVLFGEYFGDLGRRVLDLHPLWMDRKEAVLPFLGLAVALGLVHILLGLVLGVLSTARSHPRQAAGRGLSAVMIVLIVLALLAAVEVLPHGLLTPMVIALLVAFPILVVVEGIIAPVELLATLGHVLSYTRIMALGTASVMLAIVANQMVGAMGSVVVGVLFALLFHLVNFALGLFSPTIHALRLHYVEFFGTFFSPGGERYRPLAHWSPRLAAEPPPTRSPA